MEKCPVFLFQEATTQLLQSLVGLTTQWEGKNNHITYDEILSSNSTIASPFVANKYLHDHRF
jgi:hypothetical protein